MQTSTLAADAPADAQPFRVTYEHVQLTGGWLLLRQFGAEDPFTGEVQNVRRVRVGTVQAASREDAVRKAIGVLFGDD